MSDGVKIELWLILSNENKIESTIDVYLEKRIHDVRRLYLEPGKIKSDPPERVFSLSSTERTQYRNILLTSEEQSLLQQLQDKIFQRIEDAVYVKETF